MADICSDTDALRIMAHAVRHGLYHVGDEDGNQYVATDLWVSTSHGIRLELDHVLTLLANQCHDAGLVIKNLNRELVKRTHPAPTALLSAPPETEGEGDA